MHLIESLRTSQGFDHFSEKDLETLAGAISRSQFPDGATVLREGDLTLDAYLVASGQIAIQRKTPYGMYDLAQLLPGELFGETSFIDHEPRSGSATAVGDTDLLVFNPLALSVLMERDLRLAVALYWLFWKSLSTKLRHTNGLLTEFFSETGKPSTVDPAADSVAPSDFQIDLATKRKLFQEQRLSPLEINFLSTLSKERSYSAGETIFCEGDAADAMFVVLEGRVMISKYIPGAGEEALAFLERGEFFGEMALIDHQPRSATVKAHDGSTVVLQISRQVVEGILDIHKISSVSLLKLFCNLIAKRLRELDDKIVGWYILAGGTLSSETR